MCPAGEYAGSDAAVANADAAAGSAIRDPGRDVTPDSTPHCKNDATNTRVARRTRRNSPADRTSVRQNSRSQPLVLTLALHQLLRRGSRSGRLLPPALPILPVLPASLLATAHAGAVTTARLHATPALRGTTARFAAIPRLRTRRHKLLLAVLEQATANPVTTPRLWPKRCRIVK